jgi:hypothetical protein
MKLFRRGTGIILFLCIGSFAYAQYDNNDIVEDWTLEDVEEEAPKPQHKEYRNSLYLQYSPGRYYTDDVKQKFNEFSIGYARYIQVLEEKPFFVELGANLKYSHARENGQNLDLLTFRIPVNVLYKFYLSKTRDIALAPYAGVHLRAIAAGKEENWKSFQIGWQSGLRLYINKVYIGVSYAKEFPDENKNPHVHECSVHVGYCF